MKTHDKIYAKTHAELLNTLLHKQLRSYMQCRYYLQDGYTIWMIRLDGKQSKAGGVNEIHNDGNTINEIFTGRQEERLPSHKTFPRGEKRLVFEIYGNSNRDRYYMFRGVFELDKSSNNQYRKWNKISDYYKFK